MSKILVTFRHKRAVSSAASMLITYPGTEDAFIARVREHLSEARAGLTAIWDMNGARHVVTRLKSGCLHTSNPLR